jgi:hypothetical protein
MCIDRLHWLSVKNFVARDPNPGDPDVHPVREPEPEPDTPEPEPGDEPRRIDPVRARGVTDLAIVIA